MKVNVQLRTRQPCTEVIDLSDPNLPEQSLEFIIREDTFSFDSPQPLNRIRQPNMQNALQKFKSHLEDLKFQEEILLREENRIQKRRQRIDRLKTPLRNRKKTRSQKINESALRVIQAVNSSSTTFSKLARDCGVSRKFATKVAKDYLRNNIIYESQLSHSSEKRLELIDELINEDELRYSSVNDLRRHLGLKGVKASPGLLRKRLRKANREYGAPIDKGSTKKLRTPTESDLRTISENLTTISEILSCKWAGLFSTDEFKCPIVQIPKRFWRRKNQATDKTRFGPEEVITCAVFSDLKSFLTVQFFRKELASEDFEYFFTKSVKITCGNVKLMKTCLDCASWHSSKRLQTKISKLMMFNVPGWYELNPIESMFSSVRSKFRTREVFNTLDGEIREMIRILQEANTVSKKGGFERNFIRTCISTIEKYFPKTK